MLQLDSGNVLLKPSHRKQLLTWLRRALKLGQKIGDFFIRISLHRSGRSVNIIAEVRDSLGNFQVRARNNDWRTAMRETAHMLSLRLHDQRLTQAM